MTRLHELKKLYREKKEEIEKIKAEIRAITGSMEDLETAVARGSGLFYSAPSASPVIHANVRFRPFGQNHPVHRHSSMER